MDEIVNAQDDSIFGTTSIKVFGLRYADAKELANVIKELFQPTQQQGNRGGGFGGGGFGGGGFGGGGVGGGGGGGGGVARGGGWGCRGRRGGVRGVGQT